MPANYLPRLLSIAGHVSRPPPPRPSCRQAPAAVPTSCDAGDDGADAFVALSNGVRMPAVGFGTGIGQADVERHGAGSQGAVTADVVGCALDLGYTAIDTAQRYGTEPYIGAVLAERFRSGDLTRDSIFITTKVANPRPAPPGMQPGGGLQYMLQPQLSAYDGVRAEFEKCLSVTDSATSFWGRGCRNAHAGCRLVPRCVPSACHLTVISCVRAGFRVLESRPGFRGLAPHTLPGSTCVVLAAWGLAPHPSTSSQTCLAHCAPASRFVSGSGRHFAQPTGGAEEAAGRLARAGVSVRRGPVSCHRRVQLCRAPPEGAPGRGHRLPHGQPARAAPALAATLAGALVRGTQRTWASQPISQRAPTTHAQRAADVYAPCAITSVSWVDRWLSLPTRHCPAVTWRTRPSDRLRPSTE
jgi:hypothetical protein